MKVLIVHPMFYMYGGAELAIVKLIEYLKSKNHTVDLLTVGTIPDVKVDIKADNIIYANNLAELQQLLSSIYLGYNVLNFHNHPAEVLLNVAYPSVWFMNEPSQDALDGKVVDAKEVDSVVKNITKIAVSDIYNKGRAKEIYGRDDAVIIPYGVDCDYFSSGEGDRWFFKTDGKFAIGHAGWLHQKKNQMKTLEVFNNIKDKLKDANVTFIGKFTIYLNEMLKYINDNKLQDRVTIEGFADRGYLRRFYKSIDVLIHPMKDQGGWLVPLEAICAGVPVIVSNEAVFSSYFKEHELAIVTSDYEAAILDVYSNREKYRDFTAKAKEYIAKKLTWDIYGSKVEALLKEACK